MIDVSLLELVRDGEFGPLRHGITREELREHLGEPPLWGTQQDTNVAEIWRYGDVEFHFSKTGLELIFSDHGDLTNGGPTLRIDPWILSIGLPRRRFEAGLSGEGINFTVSRFSHDESQMHVTTESGVVFSFVDEPVEEFDQSGLIAWWSTRID